MMLALIPVGGPAHASWASNCFIGLLMCAGERAYLLAEIAGPRDPPIEEELVWDKVDGFDVLRSTPLSLDAVVDVAHRAAERRDLASYCARGARNRAYRGERARAISAARTACEIAARVAWDDSPDAAFAEYAAQVRDLLAIVGWL